jgi:hypothetical protein
MVAEFGELGAQLVDLESGEPTQWHVEDGVGLDPRRARSVSMRLLRAAAVSADSRMILMTSSMLSTAMIRPFEDVSPCLRLIETELGPTLDHFHLMIEVVAEHLGQVQRARNPVDQGHHVVTEAVLERGVLVELVEHHLGDGPLLELDDEAGAARSVGRLVAGIGDTTSSSWSRPAP